MKVAVIGCGPSGLAAAHAAAGLTDDIQIFAPTKQTPQRGPIMLHRPIPGINTEQPDGYVRQIVIGGSILEYRLKLYGDVNIAINGDILEEGFHTWEIPEAYQRMWNLYHERIVDGLLTPTDVDALDTEFDLVVSTASARSLCHRPDHGERADDSHSFRSMPIDLLPWYSYPDQPPNTVIYNSYEHIPWVRSSRIFGAEVTEYKPGEAPREHFAAVIRIYKPLSTDCNCHPTVLRTGRFGKWHNETWIDHAFYDTRTALVSMVHQNEWDSVV